MKTDLQLQRDLVRYNIERKTSLSNGVQPHDIPNLQNRLKSRYAKTSRIKKQILYLLVQYKYVYFCTFTFSDDYINKCDRTKRDMIKKVLYSFDKDINFILNIDFGKLNDREHYHGIVATNNFIPLWLYLDLYYPCFKHCEYVYFDSKTDLSKISKYIDKLSNHATKGTTKSSRVYSNFKSFWGPYITPTDRMILLDEYRKLLEFFYL